MQTVLARVAGSAILAALLVVGATRSASAQMIVSDPQTEYETMETALQTYSTYQTDLQSLQAQLANSALGNLAGNTNIAGDLAQLRADLQNAGNGDTNGLSVENANLGAALSSNYGTYTPGLSYDQGEQQFSTLVNNQIASVIQALNVNQSAYQRAQTTTSTVAAYQAANTSSQGTNELLQTTNTLLIEILQELAYEEAANSIRMQAILSTSAGSSELQVTAQQADDNFSAAQQQADLVNHAGIAW
jgi:hypothetical protein